MLQNLHFVSPQKSQYFTVIPICSIETLSQVFINFKGTTHYCQQCSLAPVVCKETSLIAFIQFSISYLFTYGRPAYTLTFKEIGRQSRIATHPLILSCQALIS